MRRAYAAGDIPRDPDIRDPAGFLRSASQDEVSGFAEVGYVRLDEAPRVYVYTWKGAILGAWNFLWPVNPIRKMLRRRKAARMLHELGLDGPMSSV